MRPPQLALDEEAAAQSTVHGRVIFVLATPESGAERVVAALGALPGGVAAPVPTHVFSQGIDWILDHWWIGGDVHALSGLADAQSVLLAARCLADAPYAAFLDRTGADRVVEYSPDHIKFADEIAGLYPDACLVHVVRDGRQVAARLSSPVRDLSPRDAARRWVDDQRIMRGVEHPNLAAIRIEDLLREPARLLAALAEFLGFDADEKAIERATNELGCAATLPTISTGRAGAIVQIVGPELLVEWEYESGASGAPQTMAAWADLALGGGVGASRKFAADVGPRMVTRARKFRRALAR